MSDFLESRLTASTMWRSALAVFAAALGFSAVVVQSAPARDQQSPRHLAAAGVKAEGKRIVACANRERERRGILPLAMSDGLTRAARYHARNMASYEFFDHTDPWGQEPADRVALFDDREWAVGENISAGYRSVKAACRGWMASAGHRENTLDPAYGYLGGGYARGGPYGRYYVQVFGIRMDAPEEEAGDAAEPEGGG